MVLNTDNSNNETPIIISNFKNLVVCDISSDDNDYYDDISSSNLPKYHRKMFIDTNINNTPENTFNDFAIIINDIINEINIIKNDIKYLKNNIKTYTPNSNDLKTNKFHKYKKCTKCIIM